MLQELMIRLRQKPALRPFLCGPSYYRHLHTTSEGYAGTHWLLSELETLRSLTPAPSILEVGCGNGQFIARAADNWETVVGVDWARAPAIDGILAAHPKISFQQGNICELSAGDVGVPPGGFGLVVSSDVLEHISRRNLPALIAKLNTWGTINFHKIACYDDGHSHLSVLSASEWLDLFRANDPNYRVVAESFRKPKKPGRPQKPVIVVSNAPQNARV